MKLQWTLPMAALALLSPGLTSQADPVSTYAWHYDRVDARAADVYRVRYTGGEYGDVKAIATDLDDDIDIKVYDPNGVLVASDTDSDGIPECRWWVSGDYEWRTYTIRVVNCEYHSVDYRILPY